MPLDAARYWLILLYIQGFLRRFPPRMDPRRWFAALFWRNTEIPQADRFVVCRLTHNKAIFRLGWLPGVCVLLSGPFASRPRSGGCPAPLFFHHRRMVFRREPQFLLLFLPQQPQPLRLVVRAPQAVQLGEDSRQPGKMLLRVEVLGQQPLGRLHELDGEHIAVMVAQGIGADRPVQFLGMLHQAPAQFEAILVLDPVLVAALHPLGEVGLFDGLTVEVGLEDGLDFGEGVEPVHQYLADFAVAEAVVEFFAELVGEAGNFSGAHGELIG